ncbi:MAG: 50S ribosomal protein L6 [Microgenomates bacterium 39_7]|nr:MAG: 50S ribosomal protein L6 [Microgenomates bacterium 39_7]
MSKIGKKPISVPSGVKVEIEKSQVKVSSSKGSLSSPIFRGIKVEVNDDEIRVTRTRNDSQSRSYHGLVRSLIENNIVGITQGYKKTLKLVGTGYRAKKKGQGLELAVGYSHSVDFNPPQGVLIELEGEDTIHVSGIDKQAVGQVAANIRAIKPPEPYQGKGIRYEDELVKIKPGKAAVEK